MAHKLFATFTFLALLLTLAGLPFESVRASSIVVTNANDSGAGSLRQAITDANDGDTITFSPALDISGGTKISLASTLTIDKDLAIDASYLNNRIVLSGNGVRAVLITQNATVSLIDLSIRGWSEEFEGLNGAGIYNEGILALKDCELSHSYLVFSSRGGGIYNTGNVTMTNCAVLENYLDEGTGSGIYNAGSMTISNSIISGNHAGVFSFSGGPAIVNTGVMTLYDSTLNGNSSMGGPGAIGNYDGNLTVLNSTFSGNQAVASSGGAIYNSATLLVTNSTFYNNRADSDDMVEAFGGAIFNSYGGTLLVRSSTFSENRADEAGGGIYNAGGLRYSNTIIANSIKGGDCANSGGIVSQSNLVEDGTCFSPSGDPMLGPLADNGGATLTLALLPGSPAIDAGKYITSPVCPNTDQRGMPRPQGVRCDNGAYETGTLVIFRSSGAYDGGIIESSETSNRGGSINATLPTFKIGDSDQNRQFRSILSFDTSSLPDNAVILRATLKIKKQALTGIDPFTTHNSLIADSMAPFFGTSIMLQARDFQARLGFANVGTFGSTPQGKWYVVELDSGEFEYIYYINKVGDTQFRLRFLLDDDNDNQADFFTFYSGDYSIEAARPILMIEYYVP